MTPMLGIMASSISGNLDASAYFPIATTTTVGSVSNVTFSSISNTYTHLQVRYSARTNRADVQDIIRFRFNSDSGTNYAYHYLSGDSTSAGASGTTSTASPWTGLIAGNSAGTNIFGTGVTDILDYTSTNKNKTIRTLSGISDNSTGGRVYYFSNLWFATPAAITSIEIAPNYGTAFAQYSTFTLYGLKG
jgi:hypothetical protein